MTDRATYGPSRHLRHYRARGFAVVGPRSSASTQVFMVDVASRLANRVQLSTDSLSWYPKAVEAAFGWNGTDYAQIIGQYGTTVEGPKGGRYSPSPVVIGVEKVEVMASLGAR